MKKFEIKKPTFEELKKYLGRQVRCAYVSGSGRQCANGHGRLAVVGESEGKYVYWGIDAGPTMPKGSANILQDNLEDLSKYEYVGPVDNYVYWHGDDPIIIYGNE